MSVDLDRSKRFSLMMIDDACRYIIITIIK